MVTVVAPAAAAELPAAALAALVAAVVAFCRVFNFALISLTISSINLDSGLTYRITIMLVIFRREKKNIISQNISSVKCL